MKTIEEETSPKIEKNKESIKELQVALRETESVFKGIAPKVKDWRQAMTDPGKLKEKFNAKIDNRCVHIDFIFSLPFLSNLAQEIWPRDESQVDKVINLIGVWFPILRGGVIFPARVGVTLPPQPKHVFTCSTRYFR